MNGVYIRSLSVEDFTQRALPFLDKGLPSEVKRPLAKKYVRQIMPFIQERAKTLAEVVELSRFFFIEDLDYDASLLISKGMSREATLKALDKSLASLNRLKAFEAESLEGVLRPLAAELGLKTGQLFGTLRVAVTGETAAPPLFQTMAVLGKERCLRRIEAAQSRLAKRG